MNVKCKTKAMIPPADQSNEKPHCSEMKMADERGDIKKRNSKLGKEHNKQDLEVEPNDVRNIKIPLSAPKKKEEIRHAVSKTLSKIEMTKMEKIIYERQIQEKDRATSSKHDTEVLDDSAELLDATNPFRMIGQRSSHTNLKDLLEQCPIPQPPLTQRHLKTLQLNDDQALIMAEQVGKMKSGMERLQEIVTKFNCAERFKQDIDFLVENIGPAIAKFEAERTAKQANEKQKKLQKENVNKDATKMSKTDKKENDERGDN